MHAMELSESSKSNEVWSATAASKSKNVEESNKQCMICGHPMRHAGQDFTAKQIYVCDECDYAATPIINFADEAAQYDDPDYFDSWGGNIEFDYNSFREETRRQMNEYLDFISTHTQGKRLLDVGTGHGLLPYLARERGYEVEGTDLSRFVCDNLPAKVGFPVHCGQLEEIEFQNQFDIICMMHVLEHTVSPVTTMQKCRELLNPGGYVVVVVPNYRSLDTRIKDALSSRRLKKRPYKHLALGHHNYVFSPRALSMLGEKTGFRVVHQETRQGVRRKSILHRLTERYDAGAWCWIVYQSRN